MRRIASGENSKISQGLVTRHDATHAIDLSYSLAAAVIAAIPTLNAEGRSSIRRK